MINYFDAAENTLRSRSMLEKALKNLMRRQERIMRHNAPSGYPSLDTSKPYTSTKSVNDALTDCIEIAEVAREINRTKDKIDEIDSVLKQLDPQDAELLRLWYISASRTTILLGIAAHPAHTFTRDAGMKTVSALKSDRISWTNLRRVPQRPQIGISRRRSWTTLLYSRKC